MLKGLKSTLGAMDALVSSKYLGIAFVALLLQVEAPDVNVLFKI